MAMDSVSETRLQDVHPVLAAKIRQMADLLAKENLYIRVVQGLRTWKEQDALYAQGRTVPGKIVTNCPGGHSYHNFGLAVDCVPSESGLDASYSPDWNSGDYRWKKMIAVAESLGLNCGANWRTFKDWPHFQLTGRFPVGSPSEEVRNLHRQGGMKAVWQSSGITSSDPEVVLHDDEGGTL